MTLHTEVADLLSVVEYVRKSIYVISEEIVLVGFSQGGLEIISLQFPEILAQCLIGHVFQISPHLVKAYRLVFHQTIKDNRFIAIFPMPVLMVAIYNEDGGVNVMNAAWGTMLSGDQVILNLTETHKTVKNIKSRKAFTVSIADAAHVDAPIINEFPLCMECELIEYQDGEYGCGVIGKVVNMTADESVMDGDRVNMTKVSAIAFDPYTHGYYKVTERVGEAFKDGLKLR